MKPEKEKGSKMKRSVHFAVFLFMLLCCLCPGIRAADSEEIVSEYEIKLLLDGDRVLDADHLLKKEFREAFQMKKQGETYLVVYLETPDIDYLNAGWINRIRAKLGKKNGKKSAQAWTPSVLIYVTCLVGKKLRYSFMTGPSHKELLFPIRFPPGKSLLHDC